MRPAHSASGVIATKCETVYRRYMAWLHNLRQTLSYKIGHAQGLRYRLPYKAPWWADALVYERAYQDGYKARDNSTEKV